MAKKFKNSSGAVSSILLVLAVLIVIVIIVVFVVIKINANKGADTVNDSGQNPDEPPQPVYETTVEGIKFTLESAWDMGNILVSNNQSFQPNIVTTEKFIKVTIGAQNKGKINTTQSSWSIGNIVDSEGRNFVSIDQKAYNFTPKPDLCGTELKPEFEPVPCVKFYEVSKQSTGLKLQVAVSSPNTGKKQIELIDLLVK